MRLPVRVKQTAASEEDLDCCCCCCCEDSECFPLDTARRRNSNLSRRRASSAAAVNQQRKWIESNSASRLAATRKQSINRSLAVPPPVVPLYKELALLDCEGSQQDSEAFVALSSDESSSRRKLVPGSRVGLSSERYSNNWLTLREKKSAVQAMSGPTTLITENHNSSAEVATSQVTLGQRTGKLFERLKQTIISNFSAPSSSASDHKDGPSSSGEPERADDNLPMVSHQTEAIYDTPESCDFGRRVLPVKPARRPPIPPPLPPTRLEVAAAAAAAASRDCALAATAGEGHIDGSSSASVDKSKETEGDEEGIVFKESFCKSMTIVKRVSHGDHLEKFKENAAGKREEQSDKIAINLNSEQFNEDLERTSKQDINYSNFKRTTTSESLLEKAGAKEKNDDDRQAIKRLEKLRQRQDSLKSKLFNELKEGESFID